MVVDCDSPPAYILPNAAIVEEEEEEEEECEMDVYCDSEMLAAPTLPRRGMKAKLLRRGGAKKRDGKSMRAEARLKAAELQIHRQEQLILQLLRENKDLRAKMRGGRGDAATDDSHSESFPSILREVTSHSDGCSSPALLPSDVAMVANLSITDDGKGDEGEDEADLLLLEPLTRRSSVLARRKRVALRVDVDDLEVDTSRVTPARDLLRSYIPKHGFHFRTEAEEAFCSWFDTERYTRHMKRHPMLKREYSMVIETPLAGPERTAEAPQYQPEEDPGLVYATSEDEAMMGWC